MGIYKLDEASFKVFQAEIFNQRQGLMTMTKLEWYNEINIWWSSTRISLIQASCFQELVELLNKERS